MRIMKIRRTQAVADRSGDSVVFVGAQDFQETTCKSHGMHWPCRFSEQNYREVYNADGIGTGSVGALDEDQQLHPSM